MAQPSLKNLLDVAIEVAYSAGRRTLAHFNTGVAIDTKSDNTPVTVADRDAETVIRNLIGKRFPDHSILGEEQGESKGNPDYRWIIDPIDGTKSFIHGVPLFGTLVGVEVQGVSRVGVVYLPALEEMLWAAEGLGCMWNGRPAGVSRVKSLSDATLLVGSPVSAARKSGAYQTLCDAVKLVRGWGDCYGYVLVATGRADIMIDSAINPWDCAPLLPILSEAGGRFTDWSGNPTIWGPDAAGSNGLLHDPLLKILNTPKKR